MNNINCVIPAVVGLSNESLYLPHSKVLVDNMIRFADKTIVQVKNFVAGNKSRFCSTLPEQAPGYTRENYHYNLRIKNRLYVIAKKFANEGDAKPGSWRETKLKIVKLEKAVEKLKIPTGNAREIKYLLEGCLQNTSFLDRSLRETLEAIYRTPNGDSLEGLEHDLRELIRLGANPVQKIPGMDFFVVSTQLLRLRAYDILNYPKCATLKFHAALNLLFRCSSLGSYSYKPEDRELLVKTLTTRDFKDWVFRSGDGAVMESFVWQKAVGARDPQLRIPDLMAGNFMTWKELGNDQLACLFTRLCRNSLSKRGVAKVVQVLLENSEKELNENGEMIKWINFLIEARMPVEKILVRNNFNINGVDDEQQSYLSLLVEDVLFNEAKVAYDCGAKAGFGKIEGMSIHSYIADQVEKCVDQGEAGEVMRVQWEDLQSYLMQDLRPAP